MTDDVPSPANAAAPINAPLNDCACPQPPRRLMADRVLLNKPAIDPAWESRRANKMRERFPAGFKQLQQPVPTLNLVAPVQPSLTNPAPFHENQL